MKHPATFSVVCMMLIGMASLAMPAAKCLAGVDSSNLTPYDGPYVDLYEQPDGFVSGMTLIFDDEQDLRDRMTINLRRMKEVFNANTVGVYDIVHMSDVDRDHFFDQLYQNRQKVAVRIERYDEHNFDFDTAQDVDYVMNYYTSDDTEHGYTSLLDYLINHQHLDKVAYFAINMPVDDPAVAAHFQDGRNDPAWAASQVAYAREIVKRLRAKLGSDAKLYLSIFYGWDYAYPTPFYAECGADGYFINNYSYPDTQAPAQDATDSVLINQPRLQIGVDKYLAQYGGAPLIVEHGFHTLEFNAYKPVNQTAGLVQNLAAKKKAMDVAQAYYEKAAASGAYGSAAGQSLNFKGGMFFALNLYKEEGNPPAVCDWTVDYPVHGIIEAEDPLYTVYHGGLAATADDAASGGAMVVLDDDSKSLTFFNASKGNGFEIRYCASAEGCLSLYINGRFRQKVSLTASEGWAHAQVNLSIPNLASVQLKREAGDAPIRIDYIRIYE